MSLNHILGKSDVVIEYTDERSLKLVGVEKISVGDKWIFLKFLDDKRMQFPVLGVKRVMEGENVYVKGNRNDVKSSNTPDIS